MQIRREIVNYVGHINSATANHIMIVFGLKSLNAEHVN
jgi:hypothetical protein